MHTRARTHISPFSDLVFTHTHIHTNVPERVRLRVARDVELPEVTRHVRPGFVHRILLKMRETKGDYGEALRRQGGRWYEPHPSFNEVNVREV